MKPIRLTIDEPCQQNWNEMLPGEQGKFCLSCQKNVVDFTAMSDREVLQYFNLNPTNTCGRFNNYQLNTTISVPAEKKIGKWKYLLQLLLPAIFAIHKAKAQTVIDKLPPITCHQIVVNSNQIQAAQKDSTSSIRIGGVSSVNTKPIGLTVYSKIVDNDGLPLPGASVYVVGSKHGVVTNNEGLFSIKMSITDKIRVSYVGYEQKLIDVADVKAIKAINLDSSKEGMAITLNNIVLTQSKMELQGEVIVVTGGVRKKTVRNFLHQNTKGDVSKTDTTGFWKKLFKKTPDQPLAISLKIYPNPITSGQNFKIEFTLLKNDIYQLEIMDAMGNRVQSQTLPMQIGKQDETIDGSTLQQHGIYTICLKNSVGKTEFTGKLLVK